MILVSAVALASNTESVVKAPEGSSRILYRNSRINDLCVECRPIGIPLPSQLARAP